MFGLANLITLFRIVCGPLFIYFFLSNAYLISLLIFVIASISDYYDGYFARKDNRVSRLGAFLDPIGDKVLILSALFSFGIKGLAGMWMIWIIVLRDIMVTLPRIMGYFQHKVFNEVSKLAKIKTAFQMTIIIFILVILLFTKLSGYEQIIIIMKKFWIFNGLILILMLLTLSSGFDYFIQNGKHIFGLLKKK